MTRERLHELDSMRAIAALGVVCWHYTHFKASPFGHLLAPFYRNGVLLVDFFFVLSGFVLTQAFWKEPRCTQFGANLGARIARLYPLHLFTLVLVAGMQLWLVRGLGTAPFIYKHNDAYNFVINLLLMQSSGLETGFSFNAPSWSISTEFIINVAFLLLITLPRRFAAWTMAIIGVLSVAAVIHTGLHSGPMVLGFIVNPITRTAAGFFVGVGTCRLYSRSLEAGEQRPLLWTAVAVGLAIFTYVYLSTPALFGKYSDIAICLMAFPALIVAVLKSQPVRRLLAVRPLAYLGEISYSIYLVHFPLMLALHLYEVESGRSLPYESRWFFAFFLLALVAASTLTYRLIEIPGKRLQRIVSKPAAALGGFLR